MFILEVTAEEMMILVLGVGMLPPDAPEPIEACINGLVAKMEAVIVPS
jgi:hypothetical protein